MFDFCFFLSLLYWSCNTGQSVRQADRHSSRSFMGKKHPKWNQSKKKPQSNCINFSLRLWLFRSFFLPSFLFLILLHCCHCCYNYCYCCCCRCCRRLSAIEQRKRRNACRETERRVRKWIVTMLMVGNCSFLYFAHAQLSRTLAAKVFLFDCCYCCFGWWWWFFLLLWINW